MKFLLAIVTLAFSSLCMASGNEYLFFQSAMQAKLVHLNGSEYQLVLTKTPQNVGYFTNRPARKAGFTPLTQFVSLWNQPLNTNSFAHVPPNAAISMILQNGKQQDFVAIVTNPHLSKDGVSYVVRKISPKSIEVGDSNHVNMFFDDIHWNPGGFGLASR